LTSDCGKSCEIMEEKSPGVFLRAFWGQNS
jgi:hypothetical protein